MQKAEIKPRTEYAFREKRVPGSPIERVRVLEHVRGNKWKTEWIEPNPGLVHYVESGQLCPWKERKAFLKEEESRERLVKHNDELGYAENSPIAPPCTRCLRVLARASCRSTKGYYALRQKLSTAFARAPE